MEKLRLNKKELNTVIAELSRRLENCNNYSKFRFNGGQIKDQTTIKKPTLIINTTAYIKMFLLVDSTNNEISWHGLIDKKNNTYCLYDILMFPQVNSSTHTGTEDEDYMAWLSEKITDPDFPIEHLRCHGHSHVRMNTKASSIDDEYQNNMVKNIEDNDFYIFMILNKHRAMNVYLYDFEQQVLFTEKDINIQLVNDNDGEELISWTAEMIDKYVSEPVYTYNRYKGGKKNGFKQK